MFTAHRYLWKFSKLSSNLHTKKRWLVLPTFRTDIAGGSLRKFSSLPPHPPAKKRWSLLKTLATGLAIGSAGGAAYMLSDKTRRQHAYEYYDIGYRFLTAAVVLADIAWDYKSSVSPITKEFGDNSEEYKAIRRIVDKRSAEKIRDLAMELKAMYVKAGQYASTLNHVLPQEYTDTLAELQDRAPAVDFEVIAGVIEEELKGPVSKFFKEIDHKPIAAASIAQVHRAVTVDGQEVAVKVQFPELRRQANSDLCSLLIFFELAALLFPDWQYSWLWPEIAANVALEISFIREASNGERVANLFAGRPHVHIPTIRKDLSSDRVLTQEFIRGIKPTKIDELKANKIDPLKVANVVINFFNDQIFVHGFIHCDPHAGNLLVYRKSQQFAAEKSKHPTPDQYSPDDDDWGVCILDHGMYRRLNPLFRTAYCKLWKALITQDLDLGTEAVVEMGMDEETLDALSLILVMRPAKKGSKKSNVVAQSLATSQREAGTEAARVTVPSEKIVSETITTTPSTTTVSTTETVSVVQPSLGSTTKLGGRMDEAERMQVRERYKSVTASDVNDFIKKLPRDMLFVLRNQNMVRAMNLHLGGTSRDRFRATAEAAVRGMVLTEERKVSEDDLLLDDEAETLPPAEFRRLVERAFVERELQKLFTSDPKVVQRQREQLFQAIDDARSLHDQADRIRAAFAFVYKVLGRDTDLEKEISPNNKEAILKKMSGVLVGTPTESELQLETEQEEKKKLESMGFLSRMYYNATSFSRIGHRIQLQWETSKLNLKLAWIEFMISLISWWKPEALPDTEIKAGVQFDAEGNVIHSHSDGHDSSANPRPAQRRHYTKMREVG